MTKFKFFGAVVIAMAMATPALAQQTNEVIQEPGNFAFFYPNGDLRIGSTRPAAAAMASQALSDNGAMAGMRMSARPHVRAHRASPAKY